MPNDAITIGRREMKALESLFAQEINLATAPPEVSRLSLLARLGKPIARQLIEKGLIEEIPFHAGRDALGSFSVTAYCLTLSGHYRYCAWAAEQPVEDNDAQS